MYGQSADILLFGNKITAAEAHRRNLVTKVYPDHLFEKEVWPEIARIAALPKGVSASRSNIT
jgi:enoyl-CoA hydratase/carnithine racemase